MCVEGGRRERGGGRVREREREGGSKSIAKCSQMHCE